MQIREVEIVNKLGLHARAEFSAFLDVHLMIR